MSESHPDRRTEPPPAEDLDAVVRRVDPDRWLASRFVADPLARADLIALYAFNYELSRAAEVASQPMIGEIRLAWWREAVEEIFEGRAPRRHPVVQALAEAVQRRGLSRLALDGLVDERLRDLDGWPLRPEEVEPYVEGTAGRLMALAAMVLAPGTDPHSVRHAALAWGLSGLARLRRLPRDWDAAELAHRVEQARLDAGPELRRLPVAAFPAVAYAALSGAYLRRRPPSELGRRIRLTAAVIRGRL